MSSLQYGVVLISTCSCILYYNTSNLSGPPKDKNQQRKCMQRRVNLAINLLGIAAFATAHMFDLQCQFLSGDTTQVFLFLFMQQVWLINLVLWWQFTDSRLLWPWSWTGRERERERVPVCALFDWFWLWDATPVPPLIHGPIQLFNLVLS